MESHIICPIHWPSSLWFPSLDFYQFPDFVNIFEGGKLEAPSTKLGLTCQHQFGFQTCALPTMPYGSNSTTHWITEHQLQWLIWTWACVSQDRFLSIVSASFKWVFQLNNGLCKDHLLPRQPPLVLLSLLSPWNFFMFIPSSSTFLGVFLPQATKCHSHSLKASFIFCKRCHLDLGFCEPKSTHSFTPHNVVSSAFKKPTLYH